MFRRILFRLHLPAARRGPGDPGDVRDRGPAGVATCRSAGGRLEEHRPLCTAGLPCPDRLHHRFGRWRPPGPSGAANGEGRGVRRDMAYRLPDGSAGLRPEDGQECKPSPLR